MSKNKYLFSDLQRMRPGELPEDVNVRAETVAARREKPELMKALRDARENCWYCVIEDRDNNTGMLFADYHFKHGVCHQFYRTVHHGGGIMSRISVQNEMVDMSKPKKFKEA